MNVVKKIFIALIAVAAVLLVVSFLLPSQVHVERSITINTAPHTVFKQVNVLKNWQKWSPWEKMDTAALRSYEGPPEGVGASYSWDGEILKQGTLTIIESTPDEAILTLLNFREQGTGKGSWRFTSIEEGVLVTWGFDTEVYGPVEKFFGLMMEGMLGSQMEQGLANMKEISELPPDNPMIEAAKDSLSASY